MKRGGLAGDFAPYFNWLMDIVGGDAWWEGREDVLIRLFERKYYWRLPIDGTLKNHIVDLRAKAIRVGKILPIFVPNGEPSVLEVLVFLSTKIYFDIMYDSQKDPIEEVPLYFRDLIEALGFDCEEQHIDQAIDRFLSGENKIADCGDLDATLWQQCNQLYMERWDIENPGDFE